MEYQNWNLTTIPFRSSLTEKGSSLETEPLMIKKCREQNTYFNIQENNVSKKNTTNMHQILFGDELYTSYIRYQVCDSGHSLNTRGLLHSYYHNQTQTNLIIVLG